MTRTARKAAKATWALHDAKARFSEVVRRAKAEGPQRITLHGRDEVVVLASSDYRRVFGEPTGAVLVDVLRSSRIGTLRIERRSAPAPVRDVDL